MSTIHHPVFLPAIQLALMLLMSGNLAFRITTVIAALLAVTLAAPHRSFFSAVLSKAPPPHRNTHVRLITNIPVHLKQRRCNFKRLFSLQPLAQSKLRLWFEVEMSFWWIAWKVWKADCSPLRRLFASVLRCTTGSRARNVQYFVVFSISQQEKRWRKNVSISCPLLKYVDLMRSGKRQSMSGPPKPTPTRGATTVG